MHSQCDILSLCVETHQRYRVSAQNELERHILSSGRLRGESGSNVAPSAWRTERREIWAKPSNRRASAQFRQMRSPFSIGRECAWGSGIKFNEIPRRGVSRCVCVCVCVQNQYDDVMGTYPFIDVRLMNQDNADLANECHTCRGNESDLSADLTRKISAALSGWSALGPVPSGIHRLSKSSRIFLLSTLYHCEHTKHDCRHFYYRRSGSSPYFFLIYPETLFAFFIIH